MKRRRYIYRKRLRICVAPRFWTIAVGPYGRALKLSHWSHA